MTPYVQAPLIWSDLNTDAKGAALIFLFQKHKQVTEVTEEGKSASEHKQLQKNLNS